MHAYLKCGLHHIAAANGRSQLYRSYSGNFLFDIYFLFYKLMTYFSQSRLTWKLSSRKQNVQMILLPFFVVFPQSDFAFLVTHREIKTLYRRFRRLDKTNSGVISTPE